MSGAVPNGLIVKICGITSREDAIASLEAGATALGFNFCLKSPRYISPEIARSIGKDLSILKVGVFVDESPADVKRIAAFSGLDVVQLHGNEPYEAMPEGLRIWKAFRVTESWRPEPLASYRVEACLLDGPAPGTGTGFAWKLARALPQRIIVAGGLDGSNVMDAIRELRPWGVDACSKLERAPGIKDHEKVKQFVAAALAQKL